MISIYGGTFDCLTDKVLKLQKKTVRLVMKSPGYAPSAPIFDELRILDFTKLYAFNVMYTLYPRLGAVARPDHRYETRFRTERLLPCTNISKRVYRKSMMLNCQRLYNALPNDIRNYLDNNALVCQRSFIKKIVCQQVNKLCFRDAPNSYLSRANPCTEVGECAVHTAWDSSSLQLNRRSPERHRAETERSGRTQQVFAETTPTSSATPSALPSASPIGPIHARTHGPAG